MLLVRQAQDNGVYTTRAEVEQFIKQLEDRFPNKDEVTENSITGTHARSGQPYQHVDRFLSPMKNTIMVIKFMIHFNAHLTGNPPRSTTRGKPTPEIQEATEKSERDIRAIKTVIYERCTLCKQDELVTAIEVTPQM